MLDSAGDGFSVQTRARAVTIAARSSRGDAVLGRDHPGELLEALEDRVEDVRAGRILFVDASWTSRHVR